MKPSLLILQARPQSVLDALAREYQVHDLARAPDPEAMLAEFGGDIRGIVTNGRHGAGAELIARLPNLEIISCFGVGFEAVHLPSVRKRGILLTNAPGTNDVGVVEMALLLMLAVARSMVAIDRFVRADHWRGGKHPERGRTIAGKRLGIVGLGKIGAGLARRGAALDMKVSYYGPREKPDVPYSYYAGVTELAADSDFLVLSCPGGADTFHLVDEKVLRALGPDGVLINVARGTVADPVALIAALRDGIIRGAGLDVFEGEPNLPAELFALENVTLAPHMGAITWEALENGTNLLLDNLRAHFAGEPVLTPVE